jgi:hypothetical protein
MGEFLRWNSGLKKKLFKSKSIPITLITLIRDQYFMIELIIDNKNPEKNIVVLTQLKS